MIRIPTARKRKTNRTNKYIYVYDEEYAVGRGIRKMDTDFRLRYPTRETAVVPNNADAVIADSKINLI